MAQPAQGGFRLFFTGDTRGYLEPCGCGQGQFGGLARRSTYLKENARPGDLRIDLGNLSSGSRPHDRLRLNYLLQGLRALRYHALVPGGGELELGEDFERAAAASKSPVVVCANLYRRGTAERVFAPYYLHESTGGMRVAVIGVTTPFQNPASRFEVRDPTTDLGPVIEEARRIADVTIVAGWIEGQGALDLAARFEDVALVAAGKVPSASDGLLRRGGAPVVLGGDRAQYVTAVDFDARGRAEQARHAWLGESVPDGIELAALVLDHAATAKRLGDEFVRSALGVFAAEGRTGSDACRECHPEAYATWKGSTHAHAVASLQARDRQKDPNCLECHLQDRRAAGVEADPLSLGVGCEACHGGGALHVRAERARAPGVPLRLLADASASHCTKCHNPENSPRFDPQVYWARIAHGKR